MIVPVSSASDKPDSIVKMADDLIGFVQRAVQQGSDFGTFERALFQRVPTRTSIDWVGHLDAPTTATGSGLVRHASATRQTQSPTTGGELLGLSSSKHRPTGLALPHIYHAR